MNRRERELVLGAQDQSCLQRIKSGKWVRAAQLKVRRGFIDINWEPIFSETDRLLPFNPLSSFPSVRFISLGFQRPPGVINATEIQVNSHSFCISARSFSASLLYSLQLRFHDKCHYSCLKDFISVLGPWSFYVLLFLQRKFQLSKMSCFHMPMFH